MRLQQLRQAEMIDGGAYPEISEGALLCLGGLVGLTPSLKAGGNGQPLVQAAEALRPDFAADAEFIDRELFVSETPGE